MPTNNPSSNEAGAASPRTRRKMLSFEPNADFFVIDESIAEVGGVDSGGDNAVQRARQHSQDGRPVSGENRSLMGPVLRRKKVVSMPLGGYNDFFYGDRRGEPIMTTTIGEGTAVTGGGSFPGPTQARSTISGPIQAQPRSTNYRVRQHTAPSHGFFEPIVTPESPSRPLRKKTNSFMAGVLARRAVALDLLPPEEADLGVYEFFHHPQEPVLPTPTPILTGGLDQGEETKEDDLAEGRVTIEEGRGEEEEASLEEETEVKVKLFKPLIFPPRVATKGGGAGHGTHPSHGKGKESTDAETAVPLTSKPPSTKETNESTDDSGQETIDLIEKYDDSHIIRATKKDYFFTGILFCVMAALVGVVVGWDTHLDESDSIFGPVGLACKTPCRGDIYDQDYFRGQNTFKTGDVIVLVPHIDTTLTENSYLRMIIRGVETNQTKWISPDDVFGPASVEGERVAKEERVTVNWDHPEEQHVIDVLSTTGSQELPPPYYEVSVSGYESEGEASHEDGKAHTGDATNNETVEAQEHQRKLSAAGGSNSYARSDVPHHGELTYSLYASSLSPLADQSVLIAALIMIFVYVFILLEPIHRTLIALFGSFTALFFLFLMHGGHTESISTIMLHMEWSTLGLLFGMMLLVGELSHTGVFEWCSVRLLVASKGSFNRLMVLLCSLVALSSAFLDNVTTMLLIAPVTIDMCNILGVDPRPYLIGEVLLSNVGGTATLIGDPPNIIIGSSFEEIGFVDFIINILPCIFLFCVPVSLFLTLRIYKHYLTSEGMVALDVRQLKRTYQIYDQPRLLIAGTSTFFVILMFFLHPVHHKDTAWIALLGAFITIAFTNPHDVQDALRNHVEWDTLLFFAGLFVLVEVCAAMGLLQAIGDVLASFIKSQDEEQQLAVAITLILWVSAITSAFLDNIPYTATMIPVVSILANELPETLPIETLAWALSFGACLGGNGTLLGASANIVTAGLSTSRGYSITFLNFFYPGMLTMIVTVAIANIYMLVIYVWI